MESTEGHIAQCPGHMTGALHCTITPKDDDLLERSDDGVQRIPEPSIYDIRVRGLATFMDIPAVMADMVAIALSTVDTDHVIPDIVGAVSRCLRRQKVLRPWH